jgi:hypothetical protein
MHFVFEAREEDGAWVASWSGIVPPPGGIIVTEAATKEALTDSVKEAIESHLLLTSASEASFTFEILYD